jgi:hypothetical protein
VRLLASPLQCGGQAWWCDFKAVVLAPHQCLWLTAVCIAVFCFLDSLCTADRYFKDIKEQIDEELLVLPTDAAIFEDEGFRPHAEKYAEDQDAFFKDYVESHLKLSELGAKWEGEPLVLSPSNAA